MNPDKTELLPITEQENPRTTKLSSLPVIEILRLMNQEDEQVASAIALVVPDIAEAVDRIVERLCATGRLFYIGTGTSGRLGVLDAAECPPTFGVSSDMVQAVIAGGYEACYRAVEASEDDTEAGASDLKSRGFEARDVIVGIAASGSTPYTIGALSFARSLGAFTVAISCAPDSPITKVADISIVPVVGPEVVTGSTRLKAGTAQKMVLNMLSTATMVRLGYVTGNRMSNLQTRNTKLRDRAIRILSAETGIDETSAIKALDLANGDLRIALVSVRTGYDSRQAQDALERTDWVVDAAVEKLKLHS